MVNKFIRRSSSILFRRQTTILSAALIMMVLVLASRFLGLWRNWFLARYFGASGTLDAFNAAFVIPDLIANVLITGALSVAFIPVFTTFIIKKQNREAEILASSILNLVLIIYSIFAIVVFVFPLQINNLLGIRLNPPFDQITANLMRIIIFGEFFLVIGSFLTSVLQSYHRFLISALAPVLYNAGIIFGIVVLSRSFGINGVGFGVVVGASLHMLIQLFALNKIGFNYRSILNLRDPDVIKILKLSLPRAIGVGVGQLEILVNVIIASSLTIGSIAVLKFSADLQNLPIGLFGLTIATAALPSLSSEWAAKNIEHFKKTFLNCLFQMLYLAIPLSVLLAVLRIPIVRLVLGSGLFDWAATVATATTLSLFAIGVFAQAGFLLVTRAFYAMHDTVTPLKIAIISLIFHVTISLYLVFVFGKNSAIPVSYLGLATSISGMFSFFTLFFLLDRRLDHFDRKQLFYPLVKIIVPALLMAVVLYVPLHLRLPNGEFVIDYIIDTKRALNLLFLTGLVSLTGLVVYVSTTWWFKSEELFNFAKMIPDVKKVTKILEFEEPVDTTHSAPHV